jgi:hypothetical protein
MERRLAGETEVLGENLPPCHFWPSQTSTCPDPVLNPGRRGGKPTTNRLSYGAASALELRNEQVRNTRIFHSFHIMTLAISIFLSLSLSYTHTVSLIRTRQFAYAGEST